MDNEQVQTTEEQTQTQETTESTFEIPEKFKGKSMEDVIKSYTELERKLSESSKPKGALDKMMDQAKEDTQKAQEKAQEESVDGMVRQAFMELDEAGEVSEGTLEALGKAGFTKAEIAAFTEFRQTQVEKARSALEEIAGDDDLNEILNWASENYSDEELALFNSQFQSGKTKFFKLIKDDWLETAGTKEEVITDIDQAEEVEEKPKFKRGEGRSTGSATFKTKAEMSEALADPRYMADQNYRNSVDKKVERFIKKYGS